jgi:hypothetical protein
MSLYIKRFAERVQTLDNKRAKDFIWPLQDAKNLQTELVKILSDLDELRSSAAKGDTTIQVELKGEHW